MGGPLEGSGGLGLSARQHLPGRILVMGCNPGRILEVVEVPMARPRHPEQCTSPLFLATCKHLEALIHCN